MSAIHSFQRRLSLGIGQSPGAHVAEVAHPPRVLQPVGNRLGSHLVGVARGLSNVAAARLAGNTRQLSQSEVLARYDRIKLNRGEHWVDVGSGDGHTLGEIGKRHPQGYVRGFDFDGAPVLENELARNAPHLTKLPENTRYVVMYAYQFSQSSTPYPGRTDRIVLKSSDDMRESRGERARRAIVEHGGSAKVVSVFFPFVHGLHDKSTAYFGKVEGQINYMTVADKLMRIKSVLTLESRWLMDSTVVELETAIDVLIPGGTGIIMTESEVARDLVVKWLAANQQVGEVVFHDNYMNADTMRSVGIREHIVPSGKGNDVVLGDGYMIIFTKK